MKEVKEVNEVNEVTLPRPLPVAVNAFGQAVRGAFTSFTSFTVLP